MIHSDDIFGLKAAGAARQKAERRERMCGRYEVLDVLGEGSFGTVYACRDMVLCNWKVALKTFPRDVLTCADGITDLQREVLALSTLNHTHVAKFYEFVTSDSFVGFTMEYLGGGCISDTDAPGHLLPVRQVVHRLLQVCAGLEAIHNAGLIHRDIKPDNLLLSDRGIVKVADFGIALPVGALVADDGLRVFRRSMESAHADDRIVGTPDYMSPEQIASTRIDHRADIYSVGVVAYELITGQVPFADVPLERLLVVKLTKDPAPPSERDSRCPKELNDVIMKAMARNPDERYQSVEELLADLWEAERIIERHEVRRMADEEAKIAREKHTLLLASIFTIVVVLFALLLSLAAYSYLHTFPGDNALSLKPANLSYFRFD